MNARLDLQILGWLLVLLGLFQGVPILAALVFDESSFPYVVSGALAVALGLGLISSNRTSDQRLHPRDGFVVVGSAWILASIVGAFPYVAAGVLGPIDAIFESASGFTTTGSTVLVDIEAAPKALLLWRSFTQWLGGMGIILFAIAILPLLGMGGMQFFRAEVPGPIANKMSPRIADTARRLWFIYVGLTAIETVALLLAGLSPYESLSHAMTTMATGGFSTRGTSVGAFDSALVEWIITAFMLLAGVNFVLHYQVLVGRGREALAEPELLYYLAAIVVGSVVLASILGASGQGVEASVRLAVFQTVSILTTTGYASTNFERWPEVAQVILLLLMIPGGMAGSTSGGVKSLRCLLGLRALRATFDRLIHPHAVRPVKVHGRTVPDSILSDMWAFFAAYGILVLVATAVVAASGYDLATSISAALTSIGNVGPGLSTIGAHDHFAHFPGVTKLVLAFCMVAGRLEVFTLLVLLRPAFWRR